MDIKKTKKRFFIVALIALALIFVPLYFASPVSAADASTSIASGLASKLIGGLVDLTADAVFGVIGVIFAAVGYVLGLILYVEGLILDWVLSLTDIANAPIVKDVGYPITLSLANMFFILIMIWIAFTTILRIETYRTKELVFRLIIVALLINFSLVIGGVIIDFSQVITDFFISHASSDGSFSQTLANGLKISTFYQPGESKTVADAIGKAASIPLMVVAGEAFAILFSGISVIILGSMILLFLLRIIALWLLLIMAPIAWAASILPDTKSVWSRWWKDFMKWTFFAPVYSFFIYLAMAIDQSGGAINLKTLIPGMDKPVSPLAASSSPAAILNMAVVIVILIKGMKEAESYGLEGSKMIFEGAQKASSAVQGFAALRARQRALPASQAIAKQMAKVPLLRQAAGPLRQFNETTKAMQQKNIDDSKKRVSGWTKENIAAELKSAIDPQTKAGLFMALSEKEGGLNMLKEDEIKKNLKSLQSYEREKGPEAAQPTVDAVLKKRLNLAEEFGRSKEKIIKSIKPEEIADLDAELFADPKIASILSNSQMKALNEKGSQSQIENWVAGVSKAINKNKETKELVENEAKKRNMKVSNIVLPFKFDERMISYISKSPELINLLPKDVASAIIPEQKTSTKKESSSTEKQDTSTPKIIIAGTYTLVPPESERKK